MLLTVDHCSTEDILDHWKTYAEICNSYVQHVISYRVNKENITVVFDGGYLVLSTKDTTHFRRSEGKVGRKIIPTLAKIGCEKGCFLV